MAYEIKQYSSTEVAAICAQRLLDLILSPTPVFLLVSGGSSLKVLRELTQKIDALKPNLNTLTVSFVDERFDEIHSNFVILEKEFPFIISIFESFRATWIDTRPQKRDQYEMANWYNEKITNEISRIKKENGKIISLLGMGADGHIAGILPFPDDETMFLKQFVLTQQMVVGYDATGKNEFTKRLTCTFPTLYTSNNIIGYITGESKKNSLLQMQKKDMPFHTCPAAFLAQTKQLVEIYTDIQVNE